MNNIQMNNGSVVIVMHRGVRSQENKQKPLGTVGKGEKQWSLAEKLFSDAETENVDKSVEEDE